MRRFNFLFTICLMCSAIASFIPQSAFAIQPTLVEIKPEKDGTFTYIYKIKIDNTIIVKGGTDSPNPDFFTIFNFRGLVPGSEKQPPGWVFSSAPNGVTPIRDGHRVINPTDIARVPNLTWSKIDQDLTGPLEVSGFSARTRVEETMIGEYGSQVTRKTVGTNTPKPSATEFKEGRIGSITTPLLPKGTGATK